MKESNHTLAWTIFGLSLGSFVILVMMIIFDSIGRAMVRTALSTNPIINMAHFSAAMIFLGILYLILYLIQLILALIGIKIIKE